MGPANSPALSLRLFFIPVHPSLVSEHTLLLHDWFIAFEKSIHVRDTQGGILLCYSSCFRLGILKPPRGAGEISAFMNGYHHPGDIRVNPQNYATGYSSAEEKISCTFCCKDWPRPKLVFSLSQIRAKYLIRKNWLLFLSLRIARLANVSCMFIMKTPSNAFSNRKSHYRRYLDGQTNKYSNKQ